MGPDDNDFNPISPGGKGALGARNLFILRLLYSLVGNVFFFTFGLLLFWGRTVFSEKKQTKILGGTPRWGP